MPQRVLGHLGSPDRCYGALTGLKKNRQQSTNQSTWERQFRVLGATDLDLMDQGEATSKENWKEVGRRKNGGIENNQKRIRCRKPVATVLNVGFQYWPRRIWKWISWWVGSSNFRSKGQKLDVVWPGRELGPKKQTWDSKFQAPPKTSKNSGARRIRALQSQGFEPHPLTSWDLEV